MKHLMLTLGIVNAYDKMKVLDAHYRAIARAAPICHAFGFHLALYDFPFKMTAEQRLLRCYRVCNPMDIEFGSAF